jgi:hypothetical protein
MKLVYGAVNWVKGGGPRGGASDHSELSTCGSATGILLREGVRYVLI